MKVLLAKNHQLYVERRWIVLKSESLSRLEAKAAGNAVTSAKDLA